MPGFLIQQGATVLCMHAGQANAVVPNPRVMLSGMSSCLMTAPWLVAGCPGIPPAVPPCVTATWLTGSVRVTSNGQPLLVQSSQAICAPTGTPLLPILTQTRVMAT
ncbi:hypothetical protein [Silvibacterium acidisoli]|uniref:hypothetical protein n=1 Tax=Acidobacteriaceae bacterium ZG23-2 TaxID=2883246 RepID=UPI00406C8044